MGLIGKVRVRDIDNIPQITHAHTHTHPHSKALIFPDDITCFDNVFEQINSDNETDPLPFQIWSVFFTARSLPWNLPADIQLHGWTRHFQISKHDRFFIEHDGFDQLIQKKHTENLYMAVSHKKNPCPKELVKSAGCSARIATRFKPH